MDVDRHVVSVTASEASLPLKEFDLLEYLIRNAGRVLTRGQLIDRVWGSDYVGDTKTLDVHVKRLRGEDRAGPGGPAVPDHRARAGLQARGLRPTVRAGSVVTPDDRVAQTAKGRAVAEGREATGDAPSGHSHSADQGRDVDRRGLSGGHGRGVRPGRRSRL